MKRTYTFTATEEIVPPRCRKPRYVEQEAEVTLNIREIPSTDVEPIFKVHDFEHEPMRIIRYRRKDYRQMQDRRTDWKETPRSASEKPLWVNQSIGNMTETWLEWVLGIRLWYSRPAEEEIKKMRKKAAEIIIVDGDFYERSGEPYYSVITFGFPHNHGGTFMNLRYTEPDSRKKNYGFPATKKDAAVKTVLSVAETRQDTEYYDIIENSSCDIEVLSDTAVRKRYTEEF